MIYNETIVIAFSPKVQKGHSAIAASAATASSIGRSVNKKTIDKGRGEKEGEKHEQQSNYLHI